MLSSGFNHIATLTPDLDRLVDFYRTVFGGVVTFEMQAEEGHPRMIIVEVGEGATLNLFEVDEGDIIGERRTIGARGAIDHFGLAVPRRTDLDEVKARLEAYGCDTGDIQVLGGTEWSLFFRDPDGMELEVCCPVADGD